MTVIDASARFRRRQRRARGKSQYDLYPLPFTNKRERSMWHTTPTGDYVKDLATGKAFAVEFLRTADGTYGWNSLLSQIVGDMVKQGPRARFANGEPKLDGIAIGFLSTIGRAVAVAAHACDADRIAEA